VDYTVEVSRFDENSVSHLTDGKAYVQAAAEGKAREVAGRVSGWILGVDTDVVAPSSEILGKPADAADAVRLLKMLSGQTHLVYSGIALLYSDADCTITWQERRVVETRVTFATLPDAAIHAYVATGEPMDKAGAYGIQGMAMAFVTRIEGDPSNVVGLPLWTVAELLTDCEIPLWNQKL
jgi:septum formation protein